ncbi:MAG: hypothetical protein KDC57_16180 [Saprospiraceae bacterium]|nr:hypothetical protein [Saprospiraceae bacterium]
MRRFIYIAVFIGACFLPARTQQPLPGGVQGLRLWLQPGVINDSEARWLTDNRLTDQSGKTDSLQWMNFRPVILPQSSTPIPLDWSENSPGLTIVAVSNATAISEQSVWTIGRKNKTDLMVTNYRVADLNNQQFFDFPLERVTGPVIQTYFRRTADTLMDGHVVWLGGHPGQPEIPVQPFSGLLGDWMLYDHVLSPQERQRVDSYLAIKYGLTLDQSTPKNYLASDESLIWDARTMYPFSHRMAAIARDDDSGLLQLQANSSLLPGLPVISVGPLAKANAVNKSSLAKHTFFVWGDDDRPLVWNRDPLLGTVALQRKWAGQWTGRVDSQALNIYWDLEQLPPPDPDNHYWLILDEQNTDGGPTNPVYASKLERGENGYAFASLPESGPGRIWHFSLVQGPDFMVSPTWDAQPCSSNSNGTLTLNLWGGQSPYSLLIRQGDQRTIELNLDRDRWRTDALSTGVYDLEVRDANGQIFKNRIVLTNAPGPNLFQLDSDYHLEGGTVILKPDISPDHQPVFSWVTPGTELIHGPQLTATESGNYTLIAEEQGCLVSKQVEVLPEDQHVTPLKLYPNLIAPGGTFRLVWEEPKTEATLEVTSPTGLVVHRQRLLKPGTYRIQPGLKHPGWFVVSISWGTQKLVGKIVVQ